MRIFILFLLAGACPILAQTTPPAVTPTSAPPPPPPQWLYMGASDGLKLLDVSSIKTLPDGRRRYLVMTFFAGKPRNRATKFEFITDCAKQTAALEARTLLDGKREVTSGTMLRWETDTRMSGEMACEGKFSRWTALNGEPYFLAATLVPARAAVRASVDSTAWRQVAIAGASPERVALLADTASLAGTDISLMELSENPKDAARGRIHRVRYDCNTQTRARLFTIFFDANGFGALDSPGDGQVQPIPAASVPIRDAVCAKSVASIAAPVTGSGTILIQRNTPFPSATIAVAEKPRAQWLYLGQSDSDVRLMDLTTMNKAPSGDVRFTLVEATYDGAKSYRESEEWLVYCRAKRIRRVEYRTRDGVTNSVDDTPRLWDEPGSFSFITGNAACNTRFEPFRLMNGDPIEIVKTIGPAGEALQAGIDREGWRTLSMAGTSPNRIAYLFDGKSISGSDVTMLLSRESPDNPNPAVFSRVRLDCKARTRAILYQRTYDAKMNYNQGPGPGVTEPVPDAYKELIDAVCGRKANSFALVKGDGDRMADGSLFTDMPDAAMLAARKARADSFVRSAINASQLMQRAADEQAAKAKAGMKP